MNRPEGIVPKETGSVLTIDFESKYYAEFHREFERVSGKELKKEKTHCDNGSYHLNRGQTPIGPSVIDDACYYTIKRQTNMPVSWDWLLPDKHGLLYYYQRLLLGTSFRSANPTDFISDDNEDRSLPEEYRLRRIIKNGSVAEQVQCDAENRLFGPEAVTGIMDNIREYNAVMGAMAGGDSATLEA